MDHDCRGRHAHTCMIDTCITNCHSADKALMSFPESSAAEELVLWATANGSHLSSKVEIYVDHITGLSFRAKENICTGEKIVDCSYKTTLSYLNAIESGPVFDSHGSQPFSPEALDVLKTESPHIVGNFFLMQQYLMGSSSFWWPYLRHLHQPDQAEGLGIPMWWSDADLSFLRGTNAHPTVETIKDMWLKDWKRGFCLVNHLVHASEFTCDLYKWAASIFATRSFRASLIISPDLISVSEMERCLLLEHLKKDNFSVLLPMMDIGNHNGLNEVEWIADSTSGFVSLANLRSIQQDAQIYNFYGNKSNSELLLGYGFILPTPEQDKVYLKLSPPRDALKVRQNQICYGGLERKNPGQEFMFEVRPCSDNESTRIFSAFSPGLIDLLSCMVANEREANFLLEHPTCCLEHDGATFQKMAARNAIQTWLLLNRKLCEDIGKLSSIGQLLRNQKLALCYRNRQLDVLRAAHQLLSRLIEQFCHHHNTPCLHASYGPLPPEFMGVSINFNLISLEDAYEWLKLFPDMYDKMMNLISIDQDEPLPLDWAILIQGWDTAYWIVWICTVSLLQHAARLAQVHVELSAWMRTLDESYRRYLATTHASSYRLECDQGELETLECLNPVWTALRPAASPQDLQRTKEFAFFVTQHYTVTVKLKMLRGSSTGKSVEQRALCISQS
ncbi:hypothetical protein K3495_g8770 [Podosphaera aphanis]|nr:hypothetical protein K3495_g8770 [Podosphaera aphanis]